MSAFTHLECSVPCGAPPLDPRQIHHLCSCGMPLLARYDLDALRGWSRDSLATRERSMWRYREVMPLLDGESPITLGEGWTPLVHAAHLGARLGLSQLYVKDESLNPTNSFKARGLSAAVTRAFHLGATALSIPTAGNAGNAMAAYAARAGLEANVFMPRDVKTPFIRECELYGANITLVDGLITDAGKMAAELGKTHGWYDVSTLKEPYRIEGKKTMGYEVAEQMDWTLPDWIIYPTGGGTGMVGMWKAFAEMSALGWIDPAPRPSSGHSMPARTRLSRGKPRTRSPTACACRERLATFSCCAPCVKAAARPWRSRTPTWSPACGTSDRSRASAPHRKAAPRSTRCACSSRPAASNLITRSCSTTRAAH
jgi:threonine synthase